MRVPVKATPSRWVAIAAVATPILALVVAAFAYSRWTQPSVQPGRGDVEAVKTALRWAEQVFNQTELRIVDDDPVQVGHVVLHQLLSGLRERMSGTAAAVASYQILRLDFAGESGGNYHYAARVLVVPREREAFTRLFRGAFPYESTDTGIAATLVFAVLRRANVYRLVDVALR